MFGETKKKKERKKRAKNQARNKTVDELNRSNLQEENIDVGN